MKDPAEVHSSLMPVSIGVITSELNGGSFDLVGVFFEEASQESNPPIQHCFSTMPTCFCSPQMNE